MPSLPPAARNFPSGEKATDSPLRLAPRLKVWIGYRTGSALVGGSSVRVRLATWTGRSGSGRGTWVTGCFGSFCGGDWAFLVCKAPVVNWVREAVGQK